MTGDTLFADVILPLSLPNHYTYRIPTELRDQVCVGQRALVQFGKQKIYTAIIVKIHHTPPSQYEAKYIDLLLDEKPIVGEFQLKMWAWIADYYCCNPGDVMNAALPAGLKLESKTRILKNATDGHSQPLTDKETLVMDALDVQPSLSLEEISQILMIKSVHPIIKSLLKKGAIVIEEEVLHRYKEKKETFISLSAPFNNHLPEELFKELEKSPKQLDLLLKVIQKIRVEKKTWLKKSELSEEGIKIDSALKALQSKGILDVKKLSVDRLTGPEITNGGFQLSEVQHKAFDEIKNIFLDRDVVLLHGVTSSGKTEVYSKFIEQVIQNNGEVLFLVPEIALTTQLINRLGSRFGELAGVYHSKFNTQERSELWYKVLEGDKYKLILGARSSVFLPFQNLKMIIVDEEHETSYKQYEPSPRYQARDLAIMLGKMTGAKVLLGSATPSIESYFHASSGKYGLVEMLTRYRDIQMPEIQVADSLKGKKEGSGMFTSLLLTEMRKAIESGEQSILFQNRRGYSPRWQCESCGWTPMCYQCDISLTYHRGMHKLKCHYCGHAENPHHICQACGSGSLKMIGFGTEKIEEEIQALLPGARVARLDYDTTRSKHSYATLIRAFENREIDILVGTQMVTKGLDFDNVSLVGVLDAGQMLFQPDFRAYERAYQLMAQVSGRSGRKNKRGKVIIQSSVPEHKIIAQVMNNRYLELYEDEIQERKMYQYPPFFKLIFLTIKHNEEPKASLAAATLSKELKSNFGEFVLGPESPSVGRVRNQYLKTILLKFPLEYDLPKVKSLLKRSIQQWQTTAEYKGCRIVIDVDPY